MIKSKNIALVVACFAAGMATSAMAIENRTTMCVHGNQTRMIEVVYAGENSVPCSVEYTKAEGTKTLWSAQNKAGYCENKAAEFVQKQIGWGWSCDLVVADAAVEVKQENVAE